MWSRFKQGVKNFVEEPLFFKETLPHFFTKKIPDFFNKTIPHYFTTKIPQKLEMSIENFNPYEGVDQAWPGSFLLHLRSAAVSVFADDDTADALVFRRGFKYDPKSIGEGSALKGFHQLISGNWQRLFNPFHIIRFSVGFSKAILFGLCDFLERLVTGQRKQFGPVVSHRFMTGLKIFFSIIFSSVDFFVGVPCKLLGEITDGIFNAAIGVTKASFITVGGIFQLLGYGIKSLVTSSNNSPVTATSIPPPNTHLQVVIPHEKKLSTPTPTPRKNRVPSPAEIQTALQTRRASKPVPSLMRTRSERALKKEKHYRKRSKSYGDLNKALTIKVSLFSSTEKCHVSHSSDDKKDKLGAWVSTSSS